MEVTERGALPYQRGLDGLRGVAVLLVLLFHGGVPGFGGGFLGVSVFFTLSGYLITQLLLQEHDRTGRVSLRAFWGRRLRRLAPAALLALAVVATAVVLTDVFPGPSVPGDVVAASLDVANWRFAVATSSYSDLFSSGPSPVLHFWSLAIEEQFYVLFPLVVAAVLARGGRRLLPHLLLALAAICTAAAVIAPDDLAYYATFARAPELLAGALLAFVLPIGRPAATVRAARSRAVVGVVAAVALGALVVTSEPSSPWLFRGGLPATALLSVAIIAALAVPGPLRIATEWRPLVALGLISYGVYVYHWPVFLVLDSDRTGVDGPALFTARMAVTLALAITSALLIEQPVRRGLRLRRPVWAGSTAVATLAAVCALAVLATPTVATPLVPEVEGQLLSLGRDDPKPVDVLVVGSVPRLDEWVSTAAPSGHPVRVHAAVQPGCPLRVHDRDLGGCTSLARTVADQPVPDLVVVGLGPDDREDLRSAMARMDSDPDDVAATLEAHEAGRRLIETTLAALPDTRILLVDTGPDDVLALLLRVADVEREGVTVSRPAVDSFATDLRTVLPGASDRLRVLVIGDSTSYQLAKALDIGGRGQVHVAWAGRHNCTLVPTDRIRWWKGSEFDGHECPSPTHSWPEAVAELEPDVVVAAASLPALAEHRYSASGAWVVPGDPAYTEAHDRAMADLQALVAPHGAITLVATMPPLLDGEGFDGPMGEPARLEAWTAQLARWDATWSSVGVVGWAEIALAAEASAGRPLRIDAVHFDDTALERQLAAPFADAVLARVEELRAEAARAGCRVPAPAPHLDVDRCRV